MILTPIYDGLVEELRADLSIDEPPLVPGAETDDPQIGSPGKENNGD